MFNVAADFANRKCFCTVMFCSPSCVINVSQDCVLLIIPFQFLVNVFISNDCGTLEENLVANDLLLTVWSEL